MTDKYQPGDVLEELAERIYALCLITPSQRKENNYELLDLVLTVEDTDLHHPESDIYMGFSTRHQPLQFKVDNGNFYRKVDHIDLPPEFFFNVLEKARNEPSLKKYFKIRHYPKSE